MANNYPTIRPSLNMNFAGMGVLPPDVTFTRASTSGGYYDGRTVVKAEENLFLQSGDFTNAAWVKGRTTFAGGLLAETTDSNTHVLENAAALPCVLGLAYTQTWRVKKGVGATAPDIIQLTFSGGSHGAVQYANFDILTGAVTASTGGTASIANAGGGYFDISWTAAATATGTSMLGILLFCNNNPVATRAQSYAGATTSDIEVVRAQLEQRSSVTAYTPTTTAPITNYIPKMLFAPANVPVFDHNPVTGEALGLSVWEARTNLLLRSQEFDNASWVKVNGSVTSNVAIAPDGTLTADKFTQNTATGAHEIYQNFTTAVTTYAQAFFIKAAETTKIAVRTGGSIIGVFNLSTGAWENTTGVIAPTFSSVGNGWYRVIANRVNTDTTARSFGIALLGAADASSFTGDGYSGIYIWGAQLEVGSFATPYIPTVASTVARSADVAVMTGVNFSRWFNNAEGSFVVEAVPATPTSNAASQNYMDSSDATANNRIVMFRQGVSGLSAMNVVTAGTTVVSSLTSGAAMAQDTGSKVAISYKVNDFAQSTNGAAVGTDTSGGVPVVNRLSIGVTSTDTNRLNGYIKSLSYYPARLTNAQLQAITG
jgi:hypothetical protein